MDDQDCRTTGEKVPPWQVRSRFNLQGKTAGPWPEQENEKRSRVIKDRSSGLGGLRSRQSDARMG